MKRHIKPEEIRQMRGNMFKLGQMGVNQECSCCKRPFKEDEKETKVGMVLYKPEIRKTNGVVCMECISYLESQGVRNMEHEIKNTQDKKELLRIEYRAQLEEMEKRRGSWVQAEIDKMSIERLQKEVEEGRRELKLYRKKKKAVESVDTSKWSVLERYLIEQYDVIEDKNYLKHELQIEEYFQDDYQDHFECGQGYYEDEVDVIVRIGEVFYEVRLYAEIESQRQDRGDRLYWVESLESVRYKEIKKPERKEEFKTITVSENDYERVIELLGKEGIDFRI